MVSGKNTETPKFLKYVAIYVLLTLTIVIPIELLHPPKTDTEWILVAILGLPALILGLIFPELILRIPAEIFYRLFGKLPHRERIVVFLLITLIIAAFFVIFAKHVKL